MTLSSKHSGISSKIGIGKSNRAIAKEMGVSKSMVQKHRSGETGGYRDTWHAPIVVCGKPYEPPAEGCDRCRDSTFFGVCGDCGRLVEIRMLLTY